MTDEQVVIDAQTGEIVGVDDAWERHRRIVALRNMAEETFLTLGEELFWFREKEQYKELEHPTLESYLADPDVDIAQRTAFQLMGVYHRYIIGLQLRPSQLLTAGYSKLDMLRPYMTPDNVEEWVDCAATLSRSDLKIEIAKAFKKKPKELPSGIYRIIYADPPWQYSDKLIEGYGAAEHHYSTMSIAELCEMGSALKERMGSDAVLFLWATSPMLDDAFTVIDAWGFEYKASFIWDKVEHNYGHYNSVRHEFLLVCTRGSCTPDVPELRDSVIAIPRSEVHSQKPDYFRQLIDQLYPHGNRLELFARNRTKGWDI